ncbi:hypothetical protein GJ496_011093 [Pomphorhynchus laevis]|nr:hypothetical protein GJ496_011093 [Pomphorhynchus laevis]
MQISLIHLTQGSGTILNCRAYDEFAIESLQWLPLEYAFRPDADILGLSDITCKVYAVGKLKPPQVPVLRRLHAITGKICRSSSNPTRPAVSCRRSFITRFAGNVSLPVFRLKFNNTIFVFDRFLHIDFLSGKDDRVCTGKRYEIRITILSISIEFFNTIPVIVSRIHNGVHRTLPALPKAFVQHHNYVLGYFNAHK